MDLSVVIVSYNVASFLDQALTTLCAAMRDIDGEVFVVDNASVDGSAAMVRQNHPWATLIESPENLGFAKGNNLALARSTGRLVLLLNPDTVIRETTLTTMIRFFDAHPEAGAAGCKVLNPDGTLQLACRRGFPSPGAAFFKLVGLSDLFPKSRTFAAYNLTYLDPDTLAEVDAVSGSFMMLRREVIERIGFLDEDFFMYGEDLDLCYRVKQAGWKIYYVPDTEIIHFKGESTRTVSSVKSTGDFYRAMQIFTKKHHAGSWYLPGWIVNAGIYAKMGLVLTTTALIRWRYLLLDLLLFNASFILSILWRFGIALEHAPAWSVAHWAILFVVYSGLNLVLFALLGLYGRYRFNPERALAATFLAFLFYVCFVNFVKEFNFSRIVLIYSWGVTSLTVSGWRFATELALTRRENRGRRTLLVGDLSLSVRLRDLLMAGDGPDYDIVGCVSTVPNAIRGSEESGLHVLGLVDDLAAVIRDYTIGVVIMVGSDIPFSRILNHSRQRGATYPEFKLAPRLPDTSGESSILMDIHSGHLFGA